MSPDFKTIFSGQEKEILVGGGPVSSDDLALLRSLPDPITAVDGGANHLVSGYGDVRALPQKIVGDLDSIENLEHWQNLCPVIETEDQNATDFEKAVLSSQAKSFICFGFVGGRFDQTLTLLHVCQRFSERQFVLFSEQDVIISISAEKKPQDIRFSMPSGTRFSLYPLSVCAFESSHGLLYSLDGLKMQEGKLIGTSNQTCATEVWFRLATGTCLLILPRSMHPHLGLGTHL